MAEAHVEAEYQPSKRIIFSARDRAIVNVRLEGPDGQPVGYTSYELLLIALANCTLGVVINHESLVGRTVRSARAVLNATGERSPSRVGAITVRLELDVEGANDRLQHTLQRVAEACPVGNTLRLSPQIAVELALTDSRTPALSGD